MTTKRKKSEGGSVTTVTSPLDCLKKTETLLHERWFGLVIEPFESWHLQWLVLQPGQAPMAPFLTMKYGQQLKDSGPCYTAFAGIEIVACAGVSGLWHGRAQVWSLMSNLFPKYKKGIHKAVKNYLDTCNIRRLELTLDPDSPLAVVWARRLGFTYESTMPKYGPSGELQDMYVRLQE